MLKFTEEEHARVTEAVAAAERASRYTTEVVRRTVTNGVLEVEIKFHPKPKKPRPLKRR